MDCCYDLFFTVLFCFVSAFWLNVWCVCVMLCICGAFEDWSWIWWWFRCLAGETKFRLVVMCLFCGIVNVILVLVWWIWRSVTSSEAGCEVLVLLTRKWSRLRITQWSIFNYRDLLYLCFWHLTITILIHLLLFCPSCLGCESFEIHCECLVGNLYLIVAPFYVFLCKLFELRRLLFIFPVMFYTSS